MDISPPPLARVLVVDDDPTVTRYLGLYLDKAGYQVETVRSGVEALARVNAAPPDLVILDLQMPGIDGLEVCRRLRGRGVAIVMLTGRNEPVDRVTGLELGADDYVAKPFVPRELAARVAAVLRRTRAAVPAGVTGSTRPVIAGSLTLDPLTRRATRNDNDLLLTRTEFNFLLFLMSNPGRVFTRDELLAAVWAGKDSTGVTVPATVARVRRKIEDRPAVPTRIVTVPGCGYRFDP